MRIGIDIQDVERMKSCIGRKDKLAKIFTESEMAYCQSKNWASETVAGIFCAKEAFFKALGTGVAMSYLLDIEVRYESHGAPFFKISSRLATDHRLSTSKISLSISHTKTTAVAVCIIMHFDAFV